MLRWDRWLLGVSLAGALAFVAVALLLARQLAVTSATGQPGQPAVMSLNVTSPSAVCNDPERPTNCAIPEGGSFTLSVAVESLPFDGMTQQEVGYVGFQSQLFYGDLRFKPTVSVADEIVWPQSALPLRSPASPSGEERTVSHGDVAGTSPPLPASTHTASIVQVALTCPPEPQAFKLALLPYDPIERSLGSGFKLANQETIPAKSTGQQDLDVDGDPATPAETVDVAATLEIVCFEPLPTPTPTVPNLPDLVVLGMTIELQTGTDCNFSSTTLGVRVNIGNVGKADAGPFVVDVNGEQQTAGSGLAHGETLSLWFGGYLPGENTAFVDAAAQVEEIDEGNNQLSQLLAVPTLPLPCTATPTSTPMATPTPVLLAGDVNCDDTVSSIDAALVLQFGAGLLPALSCAQNADPNNDGVINAIDAALILQFGAGLLRSL